MRPQLKATGVSWPRKDSPLRVILLTQYYSPEPPFRPAELAPILKQRGYDVTVITGFPNYPYGKLYSGYRQRLWQWEEREGVRILRLPLFPDHSQSSIRRALYFLSFAASAAIIGPLLCGKADAMHVYNDPNLGIPAFLISKLRGVPYVLEVADIWPESLSAGEMVKNQHVPHWVTKLVQFTCQHAAAVVVVSPGFKNNLVKKGIPSEKIRYIPNWGDDSIYRPVEPDLALAEKTGLAGHFNVLYAGNMGVAQGLHAVIEAAEHLRDLPDVQFVFIGDGVEKSDLERMVAEKHLINVRFLDRQSPRDARFLCAGRRSTGSFEAESPL